MKRKPAQRSVGAPPMIIKGMGETPMLRGFTLVELLVVIAILALLIGLLLPAVIKSRDKAHRVALQDELQVISSALETYKADFGDYPRPEYAAGIAVGSDDYPNPPTGAEVLCRALIGPAPATSNTVPIAAQDGADGPGFRIRGTQGRVYGPYLATDKFRVYSICSSGGGTPTFASSNQPLAGSTGAGATPFYPLAAVILDIDGSPILYFPARASKPDITAVSATAAAGGNYVGLSSLYNPPYTQFSMYDADQNWTYMHYRYSDFKAISRSAADAADGTTSNTGSIAYKRICIMLGDYNPNDPSAATNFDGAIDGTGETPASEPFILWSAGADGKFGPDCLSSDGTTFKAPTAGELSKLDDATNIQR